MIALAIVSIFNAEIDKFYQYRRDILKGYWYQGRAPPGSVFTSDSPFHCESSRYRVYLTYPYCKKKTLMLDIMAILKSLLLLLFVLVYQQ